MSYSLYHGLQYLDNGSLPGRSHSCQWLNMKATSSHSLFRIFRFLCLFSMSSTSIPPRNAVEMASSLSHVAASSLQSNKNYQRQPQNLHHRLLMKDQFADQNLQYMLNLYNRAADTDGRLREPRILGSNTIRLIRSISTQERHSATSPDLQYSYMLEYELKAIPLEKLVRAAFVHLRSPAHTHLPVSCGVSVSSQGPARRTISSDGSVTLRPHDQWTETDVTPHVSPQSKGRLSLGVRYQCVTRGQPNPLRTQLRDPALLLFLEEEGVGGAAMEGAGTAVAPARSAPRHRRSKEAGSIGADIPNYVRKNTVAKNQCKLHSYRVTFRDLGWDHWIIAPHKYNPRYCRGDCPRILHYGYNSPNHAIVQNFINEMGVGEVPPPSCVPYKYKPISVLMMEKNGNIVYKEYEDMVAESCTCR